MSTPADFPVTFDHVWKKFRLGERHDSLRDLVPAALRRLTMRQERSDLQEKEFWAVRDVSFQVAQGRALGIIGPNGAGKSTTLKLLTRIFRPTKGRMQVKGRVGALIEIAAGFHPDLTGRENVFLQGTIMGMRQQEIRDRLDDIVDFSGISRFIDTPVKRYSSGMNARLGFSIAAHLSPDVLIIDEVLSVGDVAFQAQCIERMKQFKQQGVTIVFVSHNLQAISQLCDEGLYLASEPRAFGKIGDVLAAYLETSFKDSRTEDDSPVEILDSQLLDDQGRHVATVVPGAPLVLAVTLSVRRTPGDVHMSFLCHRSTDMLPVYDGNFHEPEMKFSTWRPGTTIKVLFHFRAHLTRGQYHLELTFWDNPTQRCLSRAATAALFSVDEDRTYGGVADLAVTAEV